MVDTEAGRGWGEVLESPPRVLTPQHSLAPSFPKPSQELMPITTAWEVFCFQQVTNEKTFYLLEQVIPTCNLHGFLH